LRLFFGLRGCTLSSGGGASGHPIAGILYSGCLYVHIWTFTYSPACRVSNRGWCSHPS
jgi:hypothetical protein